MRESEKREICDLSKNGAVEEDYMIGSATVVLGGGGLVAGAILGFALGETVRSFNINPDGFTLVCMLFGVSAGGSYGLIKDIQWTREMWFGHQEINNKEK